jgi:tetratricopeptide (TPR) repeat protein
VNATAGSSALRVERALRLLPDVDVLGPLRALLVSTSHARADAEPYRTVGKRLIQPAQLRELLPRALARVNGHLESLFNAAVEALEAEQLADPVAKVQALLRAGEMEERVGRASQAYVWYRHALGIAEALHDRQPEIDTLRHLGVLQAGRDRFDDAARCFQRCYVLADAELNGEAAALACHGLGEVEMAQERFAGATAWFVRGLGLAGEERVVSATLHIDLGAIARVRGDLDAAAQHVAAARALFDRLGDVAGAARAAIEWANLETSRGRSDNALGGLRDVLARVHSDSADPRLELDIRLGLCRVQLARGQLLECEDEIRQAEEIAIVHNLARPLARLYLILGGLRGRQGDDTGFVFFEKAIELSRGPEPAPRLEAEACLEYARFLAVLGDPAESAAYRERAREVYTRIGDNNGQPRSGAPMESAAPA